MTGGLHFISCIVHMGNESIAQYNSRIKLSSLKIKDLGAEIHGNETKSDIKGIYICVCV